MTTLWDTTGTQVVKALAAERRHAGAVSSGLALTLVSVVSENLVAEAEQAATAAAAQHPCRLLVVVRHRVDAPEPRLDAEVSVGGRLGPGEVVVLRMHGRLALHAESVVLPLLAAYLLAFIYVAIYWNNHHHMMQSAHKVTGAVLWSNHALLFWLTLFPLMIRWIDEVGTRPWPVAAFGLVVEVGVDQGHPLEGEQRAGEHHRRHGEDDHEGGHDLRPDEERHAVERHTGGALLEDGDRDVHRAGEAADLH